MELKTLDLNNTIVRFRKVIGQAKFRVTNKLIRRIKMLKKKMVPEKSEELRTKYGKKLERYLEELQALKRLKRDEVSKFALLNTKTLEELKITGKTAAPERTLYKVATNDTIVSAVEEFREKYPEWHREVPFMLQRLGLQYKTRKGENEASKIKKLLKNMSLDEESGKDDEIPESVEKPTESLLSKVKKRQKQEKLAVKNKRLKPRLVVAVDRKTSSERKAKKPKSKKAKDHQSAPDMEAATTTRSSRKNSKLPEGRTGQMEIRRLRLDSEIDDQRSEHPDFNQNDANVNNAASDPFFLNGSTGQDDSNATARKKSMDTEGVQNKKMGLKLHKEHQLDKKQNASNRRSGPAIRETKADGNRQKPDYRSRKSEPDTSKSSSNNGDTKLHPSWEAKRKQRQSQGNLSAPAGKKIKFDTND